MSDAVVEPAVHEVATACWDGLPISGSSGKDSRVPAVSASDGWMAVATEGELVGSGSTLELGSSLGPGALGLDVDESVGSGEGWSDGAADGVVEAVTDGVADGAAEGVADGIGPRGVGGAGAGSGDGDHTG